jgi:hypothetical protein
MPTDLLEVEDWTVIETTQVGRKAKMWKEAAETD